ncbi:hypothetical protein H6F75_00420 [Nodosilinea sp. FACHB-131]|uniref:hypothetical protein n=1 Tax=Cyanophyceae TaxID=3028117 RepID=UPI001682CBE7|nr:hypothetical protein [Nodosilinea sp. FACHB-131]MBD1871934.1 hypothetical protein [Nodosilinea sp. FACHB-131]
MATLQDRKLKGLTNIAVFDTSVSPKLAYILETPTGAELDLGIEEVLNETTSELGETVIESSFISAQRPILSMTLPSGSPTATALRFGRKLQTAVGKTVAVEKRIRVTATNNIKVGAASGKEGNGMTADQALSQAWALDGLGIPVALTRVAHATINPETDTMSFSQGADGAYKFTEDLIGSDVFYSFPLTNQSVLEIGEDSLDQLEINLTGIMRDLRLFRMEIPSASIDFGGSGNLPIGPGELSLNLRIQYDGSTCQPIKIYWLGQARAC